MENMFKNALKRLKTIDNEGFEYFQNALFSNTSWDFIVPDFETQEIQVKSTTETSEAPADENEKSEMMNSLKEYYQKQMGTHKEEIKSDISFEVADSSNSVVREELIGLYGNKFIDKFFPDQPYKVLFLTDEYFDTDKDGDIFDCCFEEDVALLFRKMVGAMKLDPSEFRIFETNSEEAFSLFKNLVHTQKPEVVVTLGAKSISKLLEKKTRLNSVHGQRFSGSINSTSFNVYPIFHPAYLLFNEDMKMTTWQDMQKIMKKIGKI